MSTFPPPLFPPLVFDGMRVRRPDHEHTLPTFFHLSPPPNLFSSNVHNMWDTLTLADTELPSATRGRSSGTPKPARVGGGRPLRTRESVSEACWHVPAIVHTHASGFPLCASEQGNYSTGHSLLGGVPIMCC